MAMKAAQEELPLGFSTEIRCNNLISTFQEKTEAHFVWLQEILAEAKKSFASPEIVLLPKTPSCKRTRRGRLTSKAINEDEEDYMPSKKRTRKGKKTRVDELRGSLESNSSMTSSTSQDLDISADDSELESKRSTRSTRSNRTTTTKTTRSTRAKKAQSEEEPMDTSPAKSLKFEGNTPTREESDDLSAEEHQVDSTRNPCSPTRDNSRSPRKDSPRIIPGFGKLNVKAKVQAFEDLNESLNNSLNESRVASSPRIHTPRTPRQCHSASTGTPARSDSENRQKKSKATLNLSRSSKTSARESPSRSCKVVPEQSTPDKKRVSGSRRSSVRGSLSNIRKSLSRRRSSILREKLTNGSVKQTITDSLSATKARSKSRKPKGGVDMSSSDETTSTTPVKPKRTRSKLKTTKALHEGTDSEGPKSTESESESATFKTPDPVRKGTRSKAKKVKQNPESTDSEADTPIAGTPQRGSRTQSRSKERTEDTDDEAGVPTPKAQMFKAPTAAPSTMAPCRSTRSKMRKWHEQVSQSPSSFQKKRPITSADSDEETPRKKSCPGSGGSMSASTDSSEESQRTGPRILKPGDRSALAKYPSEKIIRPGNSFLSSVKKTTPSNINTTAGSFIQRHTPQKGITVQEKLQQQRQKLVAKDKQHEDRILKRQEMLAKKAEDAKRKREELQKAAAKRREEKAKKDEEARKGMEQKDKEAKTLAAKVHEEKMKEEKERQKLREKKIAEAEQRRKHEEELRLQRFKEMEEEKKQQEDLLRRKQEFEDMERKKRLEDERRQEEEKKVQAERERHKEMERLRREEERRQREEEERARQEEEKRKRERAERERQAIERQKEIERQKQEEIRRQQEMERQRVREEAERKAREEAARKAEEASRRAAAEAKVREERERQQQQSQSLNSSYTIPAGQAKLNTSAVKKVQNLDSYDMTPMRVYKTSSPNPDNYGIEDLKSDDDTDDEDQPRKRIPAWAQGANLKVALINQYYHPPNLDDLFEIIEMPDLRVMFKKQKPRFNKRTSSAIWDSPIMKHSGLP